MVPDLSRRAFIRTSGVAGGVLAGAKAVGLDAAALAQANPHPPPVKSASPPASAASQTAVTLQINGASRTVTLDTRTTLLDALREHLGLTGTKKGCDMGACGACTVLVNGRRMNACLTLAAMAEGKDIITIEGLAARERLHPLQQAFIDHDAFQCGYCTSGQIMSGVGLLKEGHAGSDADIREFMSGNICRCGAYPNIVAAIKEVRDRS